MELDYNYETAGRRHHSNQRRFRFAPEEHVTELHKWVAAHPVGSSVLCFVDPSDPTNAVLERDTPIEYAPAAMGGLFLLFGTANFATAWRARSMRRNLKGIRLTEYCLGASSKGPRTLEVSPPPWLTAMALAAGALSLAAMATWLIVKWFITRQQGQMDFISAVSGVSATVGAIWLMSKRRKHALRARQPKSTLRVTPATPTVGGALQFEWDYPTSKTFENLSIWMEGAEEAKVREVTWTPHGTQSEEKTDRSVFAKVPLVEKQSPEARGSVSIKLPAVTMHSFRGAKCGISWQIKVRVDFRSGKNLEYAFPINVRPVFP